MKTLLGVSHFHLWLELNFWKIEANVELMVVNRIRFYSIKNSNDIFDDPVWCHPTSESLKFEFSITFRALIEASKSIFFR